MSIVLGKSHTIFFLRTLRTMAGFLVKRIVVMSFLAVAFTGTDISWLNSTIGALMPIEGYLREKSQEVATYNFPEHRWSYTAQELHTFFVSAILSYHLQLVRLHWDLTTFAFIWCTNSLTSSKRSFLHFFGLIL